MFLGSLVLEISSNIRFSKKDIGESVSCDGVCLTLIRIKKNHFYFIFQKKHYNDQILNMLKGKKINIEKSLLHGQKEFGTLCTRTCRYDS